MKELKHKIEEYKRTFDEDVARVKDGKSLQDVRNFYLSRKRGCVTLLFDQLKTLTSEERPELGRPLNELKDYIQAELQNLKQKLSRGGTFQKS